MQQYRLGSNQEDPRYIQNNATKNEYNKCVFITQAEEDALLKMRLVLKEAEVTRQNQLINRMQYELSLDEKMRIAERRGSFTGYFWGFIFFIVPVMIFAYFVLSSAMERGKQSYADTASLGYPYNQLGRNGK